MDDKELKYFQLFWSCGADNTRWKTVPSDAYFPEWKPALSSFVAILFQDPKRHLEESVDSLMTSNIVQCLGAMLDTVTF